MFGILIVEDEAIIRKGLAISLDWLEFGCNIVGLAKDGREGLDMIREYRPDIIISDICMPKLNGLDMLAEAKKEYSGFYSILLTSYAEFEYARSGIEIGVSGYLLKPVDEEELGELIKSITTELKSRNRYKRIVNSVRLAENQRLFTLNSTDTVIRAVYDYIKDNFAEKISINDIADKLNLSTSYISRKLKKKLNITFVDMLNQYRIKASLAYLEQDYMIYEVSDMVGFSDYKYFCTVFKRYMSVSPSEYQKNKGENAVSHPVPGDRA